MHSWPFSYFDSYLYTYTSKHIHARFFFFVHWHFAKNHYEFIGKHTTPRGWVTHLRPVELHDGLNTHHKQGKQSVHITTLWQLVFIQEG